MSFQKPKPYSLKKSPKLYNPQKITWCVEDYLYAVNQTYAIKLRREGYVNLTEKDIESRNKNGIIESLYSIWEEHREDGWEEFDSEEVARYICEKIAIGEADFLSDKTKDKFRSLYRLIAERIRQQQNLMASQGSDKKKMSVQV